MIFTSNKWST